jgi:hypothetical protein
MILLAEGHKVSTLGLVHLHKRRNSKKRKQTPTTRYPRKGRLVVAGTGS